MPCSHQGSAHGSGAMCPWPPDPGITGRLRAMFGSRIRGSIRILVRVTALGSFRGAAGGRSRCPWLTTGDHRFPPVLAQKWRAYGFRVSILRCLRAAQRSTRRLLSRSNLCPARVADQVTLSKLSQRRISAITATTYLGMLIPVGRRRPLAVRCWLPNGSAAFQQ